MMAFETKKFKDIQSERRDNVEGPEHIEQKAVEQALFWLEKNYQAALAESEKNGGSVTEEIVKENLEHAKRVYEFATWIGEGEKKNYSKKAYDQDQFVKKLQVAAIFHDITKLVPNEPDGIDMLEHHESAAETASGLLQHIMNVNIKTAHEIKQSILSHSHTPFILEKNKNVPAPKVLIDYALRDADLLDQMDMEVFKKTVAKEADEDLGKAIMAALKSVEDARKMLHTETAKKIGKDLENRLNAFLEFIEKHGINNIEDFKLTFDEFLRERGNKV